MGTSLECSKKVVIFVKETNDRGREGTSLDCSKKLAISVNSMYGRGKTDTSLKFSQKYGDVCQRARVLVAG